MKKGVVANEKSYKLCKEYLDWCETNEKDFDDLLTINKKVLKSVIGKEKIDDYDPDINYTALADAIAEENRSTLRACREDECGHYNYVFRQWASFARKYYMAES